MGVQVRLKRSLRVLNFSKTSPGPQGRGEYDSHRVPWSAYEIGWPGGG